MAEKSAHKAAAAEVEQMKRQVQELQESVALNKETAFAFEAQVVMGEYSVGGNSSIVLVDEESLGV